jgi:hypothetical protein
VYTAIFFSYSYVNDADNELITDIFFASELCNSFIFAYALIATHSKCDLLSAKRADSNCSVDVTKIREIYSSIIYFISLSSING